MNRDEEQAGLMRRWLKLGLVALGVAVLIFVIVMMIAGGEHGPARHFSAKWQLPAVAGQGV